MQVKEARDLLVNLRNVFDVARFVDVSLTIEYDINEELEFIPQEYSCYSAWDKEYRCDNCISAKVFASKTRMSKYDFIDQDIFYIVAKHFMVENRSLVLEVISKVTDEILFGAFGKEKIIENILKHNDKLYKDTLTGAYNRAYYEEQLKALNLSSAVVMVDVDNFKGINDTYGHPVGDMVLKILVNTIKDNIRLTDSLVRFGGDEFAIFFSNMNITILKTKLETVLSKINAAKVPGYPDIMISCSMGCSEYEEGKNIIEVTDKLLYVAKKQKNCIVCSEGVLAAVPKSE